MKRPTQLFLSLGIFSVGVISLVVVRLMSPWDVYNSIHSDGFASKRGNIVFNGWKIPLDEEVVTKSKSDSISILPVSGEKIIYTISQKKTTISKFIKTTNDPKILSEYMERKENGIFSGEQSALIYLESRQNRNNVWVMVYLNQPGLVFDYWGPKAQVSKFIAFIKRVVDMNSILIDDKFYETSSSN